MNFIFDIDNWFWICVFAMFFLYFNKVVLVLVWFFYHGCKGYIIFPFIDNFVFVFYIYFGYFILFTILRFIFIYGFHGSLPVWYASNKNTWFFGKTLDNVDDDYKKKILEDEFINPILFGRKLKERRMKEEGITKDDLEDEKVSTTIKEKRSRKK